MSQRVIIIGGGQAGAQAAISLRTGGFDGSIDLIARENWLPYQRPPLSKAVLQGDMEPERTEVRSQDFYTGKEISIHTGRTVTGIDRQQQLVHGETGETWAYDWLVLATGGRLRQLKIPGSDLAGVHYLRGLDESLAIGRELTEGRRVTVVGAGYIGLEVAASAVKLGCKVQVAETLPGVLSRGAVPQVARYIQKKHEEQGVQFRLGRMAVRFLGDKQLSGVELDDGTVLDSDLAVVGIGILPEQELAEQCGLEVNDGVVVDEFGRTSDPHILAAGDNTRHLNRFLGSRSRMESVQNAVSQGKIVAATILGQELPYDEPPWFWSDQYDVKLQMVGIPDDSDELVTRGDPESGSFAVFSIRDGVLTGVQCINDAKCYVMGKKLIGQRVSVSRQLLENPETDLKSLLS